MITGMEMTCKKVECLMEVRGSALLPDFRWLLSVAGKIKDGTRKQIYDTFAILKHPATGKRFCICTDGAAMHGIQMDVPEVFTDGGYRIINRTSSCITFSKSDLDYPAAWTVVPKIGSEWRTFRMANKRNVKDSDIFELFLAVNKPHDVLISARYLDLVMDGFYEKNMEIHTKAFNEPVLFCDKLYGDGLGGRFAVVMPCRKNGRAG